MHFFPLGKQDFFFFCRPCQFGGRVCDILRSDFCVFGAVLFDESLCVFSILQQHFCANKAQTEARHSRKIQGMVSIKDKTG